VAATTSQTTTISCLFADICDEVTAVMTSGQQSSLSTACTNALGTFSVTTCSTTGAVAGHCHYTGAVVEQYTNVTIPGATMNEYYYTSGGWTPGDAQTFCETPPAGTWVP